MTWTIILEELREQLIEESVEAGVTNYGNEKVLALREMLNM